MQLVKIKSQNKTKSNTYRLNLGCDSYENKKKQLMKQSFWKLKKKTSNTNYMTLKFELEYEFVLTVQMQ